MGTISEFVALHCIRMKCERTDSNPNMSDSDRTMDHWKCVFRITTNGRASRLTTYFSMGSAHNGKAPNAAEVLDCLASDASGATGSFEDWCSDYGYDTDSRKAEKTYKIIQRQSGKLRAFLGSDFTFENLLYRTERL